MEFISIVTDVNEDNKFSGGAFGSIHRVKVGDKTVAVKVVENKNYSNTLDYRSEHRILQHLDVPGAERFITKLLHFSETEKSSFFVFEYYKTDLFYDSRTGKTRGKELFYLKKVAECVQFLHDQRVIHRDLKPENILTEGDKLVLCDFGHAIEFPESGKFLYTNAGTYEYMSPEMSFRSGYDYHVDIWSLGVLYYELLIVPFIPKEDKKIEKGNLLHGFDCSKFTKIQRDQIIKILKYKPAERPTIEEILEF